MFFGWTSKGLVYGMYFNAQEKVTYEIEDIIKDKSEEVIFFVSNFLCLFLGFGYSSVI